MALVRNEAGDLRRLLSHHRELYDEAIVVDTGSDDGSPDVARGLGATVLSFPWRDDFSAARNHGLAAATGAWVLVLDCDEVIAPADFARVRRLAGAEPTGWVFEQRNYCRSAGDAGWQPVDRTAAWAPSAAPGFVPAPTCRLFPARPDLRYEGLVHEVPDPALGRAGIRLAAADVVIHHYGHLGDTARHHEKDRRYGKLLRAKLAAQPGDVVARYELAVQLVREGRTDLARRLLARTIREAPHHRRTHAARLLLGRLLANDGETGPALALVAAAVRQWPALREGWVAAVELHARCGRPAAAGSYLREGRRLFPGDAVLSSLASQVPPAPGR